MKWLTDFRRKRLERSLDRLLTEIKEAEDIEHAARVSRQERRWENALDQSRTFRPGDDEDAARRAETTRKRAERLAKKLQKLKGLKEPKSIDELIEQLR